MHVLSWITFLPLLGAILVLFAPRNNKLAVRVLSSVFAGASFIVSVWLWINFNGGTSDLQFVEKCPWIPTFGIQYFLAIDGLSLPLIVLTTFLSLLAIIGSFHIEERIKDYFFFLLLLETAMLGVFVALDLFLFYVFWELTLVPMYFLIGIWGGPKKEYAAIKFFLFTLFGSVFMLIAFLALYFCTQPHTFDFTQLLAQNSTLLKKTQLWIFLGLWLGFAVKIPIFPFHTWLPLAHVEAPTAVSVLLAGVLLKMGTYGLMRFSFPLLPVATQSLAYWIAVIAAVNIVYGALCSLAQTDIKRMIAYSSINHMGYALLGMAALNPIGFSGATFQMVSHGLITGCLFFLVGVIYDRTHTRDIDSFGGLGAKVPVYTGLMTFACFASLGLPLLAGFVGEFLCFLGSFQVPQYRYITLISLSGVLVTAAFFLMMIKKVFLGPLNPKWDKLTDMNSRELLATVPLIVMMTVLGVLPSLLLNPIGPTLAHLVELLKLP
ncbi:MAG: NADH-quinone oxidoreductase subunit M [Elusimicrobiota bacterium]|jgi:NADH-quinone oxidoreductase subunit M